MPLKMAKRSRFASGFWLFRHLDFRQRFWSENQILELLVIMSGFSVTEGGGMEFEIV